MPELPGPDLHRVLAYQRRLVVAALAALGKLLMAGAILLLGIGFVSGWQSGVYPLQMIAGAFAVLVVGVGLAIADDYLPGVPDTGQPPTGATAGDAAVV